jgi:ferric-dicitrate binding protein FerR (iron transport regulator)
MERFQRYIEDREFVRWVLQPNPSMNDYWQNYLDDHPEEQEPVDVARQLILSLRTKNEAARGAESLDLLASILRKIDQRKRRHYFFSLGFSTLKYVAVGALFFVLGMTFYNNQKSQELKALYLMLAETRINSSHTQLLLSDGKHVAITERQSDIEYQNDGQIVINKQDTLQANAQKNEQNQVIVPYGMHSSIKLPDGTMAHLNAGSRLVYPTVFTGKDREVFLVGEGFFEVAHQEGMPFLVNTSDVEVEALGTKFNVSAYPSDPIIETVLVEGKVNVKKNGFRLMNDEFLLQPNQRAAYHKGQSETSISTVDVQNYISWHAGFLNFTTSALTHVTRKLERYYAVQIILESPGLQSKTITGKLKLVEEPEITLDVLAKTAGLELIKINEMTYALK